VIGLSGVAFGLSSRWTEQRNTAFLLAVDLHAPSPSFQRKLESSAFPRIPHEALDPSLTGPSAVDSHWDDAGFCWGDGWFAVNLSFSGE